MISLNITMHNANAFSMMSASTVYASGQSWRFWGVHGLNSTSSVFASFSTCHGYEAASCNSSMFACTSHQMHISVDVSIDSVRPAIWVMPDLIHADFFTVYGGTPSVWAGIMTDASKPSSIGELSLQCDLSVRIPRSSSSHHIVLHP